MKTNLAVLVALTAVGGGCSFARVHSSSRSHLDAKQSEIVLAGTVDDAARRVTEQLSKRGFQMTDRQERAGGASLFTFKGQRSAMTSVSDGAFVSGSTDLVGSVFYALMTPQEGATKVELVGKPTLDGEVACSEGTPDWVPPCPKEILAASRSANQMTGQQEAEAIRGTLLELNLTASSTAP